MAEPRIFYLALFFVSAALVACGPATTGPDGGVDAGATGGGTAGGGSGAGSAGGGTGGGGQDAGTPNVVTGSVDGTTPFGPVSSAWWFGSTNTVVYLFSRPVRCNEIQGQGWDTRITNDTQILEMVLFGSSLRTYPVTTSLTPAAGEASVNHTFSRTTGTPAEQFSSAGSVALAQRPQGGQATGTFTLSFGANSMNGNFDAEFCAGGVEP